LSLKKCARAGSLSGGQKRKLQLACMFVGGSSVCLLDEVTSGLVCPQALCHVFAYQARIRYPVVSYGASFSLSGPKEP
jgi:energy-coupling factor transporter ATP-binding protein EcfA2